MREDPYQDWISIFDEDIKTVWEEEREELRKVSMIYSAFQKELNKLKSSLSDELVEIKKELKKKDLLEKCKNFSGLVQSVQYDDLDLFNKENASPNKELEDPFGCNKAKEVNFDTELPTTSVQLLSPQKIIQAETPSSPILNKNSFTRPKRKNLSFFSVTSPKTPNCDDSNIMECSIIEDTPELNLVKKSKPSFRFSKKPNKKLNKSKQASTLTQMFLEPKKTKEIDTNKSSMTVTEMINLINDSDSETDQSDATVDDLEPPQPTLDSFVQNYDKIPEKKEETPKYAYQEVVRGKERQKLKGWSCHECKNYYEALNLPPDELEKKKNECSKHRGRFERQETYQGFWDLTFGPTPKSQESLENSMVFNYKTK